MRIQKFLATVLALGVLCPVISTLAKEKLRTPAQRFGGDIKQAESPSFRRHIVPLASKLGCSGRECHGSFQGRGGFQLSLFGYDFKKDHTAITNDKKDDIRVDLEHPEKSLFIVKPTKQVKHKGGEIYEEGSWEHNLMLKWIQQGAKIDVKETGEFGRLELFPKEIVFKKAGESIQIKVLAHWADGTVEDVTEFTRFRTNDESVAEVHEGGLVESKSKGDTHIVAFYDNGVSPVPVMLPISEKIARNYPKVSTRTKVDELVVDKLRKIGVLPSDVCTDAEFLRRASLDVTGTLPTPAEVKKFLADKNPNKRAKKIDELLKSPGYAAWWTTKLCDITGNNSRNNNDRNFRNELTQQWYDWIYARIRNNVPYDKMIEGMVMATSRTGPDQSYSDFALEMGSYLRKENPVDFATRPDLPQYWARRNMRKPEEKALGFAYSFLGVRIQCAQCHKHPFDQWTQQDFNQFQAFFTPITFGGKSSKDGSPNYRTVEAEIAKAVGYDRKTGSTKSRRDMYAEVKRRVAEGEVAPWQELYVRNTSYKNLSKAQLAKLKKRNPKYAGRVITPKVLGGEEEMLEKHADPRRPLMDWLRDPQNPYFAHAFVNRLWANYFGRGIVAPADDMNLANPPSNRALLDYLAKGFIQSGYNMRWLHAEILKSDTYQRSWKPNETNKLDEKNFSRMVLRRLPAEVVADAISMATSSGSRLTGYAESDERLIGWKMGINYGGRGNTAQYALGVFGKPLRETNCDCERSNDPTLLQTIFTRNDPAMLGMIDSYSKKQSSWIGELRGIYGSSRQKAVARGEAERLQRAINSISLRMKKLNANQPKRPAKDDPIALKKYLAARKSYAAQRQRLVQQEKSLRRKLTAGRKPPNRDNPGRGALPTDIKPKLDELITEVFLRTVSRYPTPEERANAKADIEAAKDPVDGLREVLWAMLNTKEFMVNH